MGMSRAADPGCSAFGDGHGAAGVMAAVYFSREQRLDEGAQAALLALIEERMLRSPIYAPRAEAAADPELVRGFLQDLEAGAATEEGACHGLIFAAASLKALRELPEAATPERMQGLRAMIRAFGTGLAPEISAGERSSYPDLDDEPGFVRAVFEEYLRAIGRYLRGGAHHGYAGHTLTIGHALLELQRMGHAAIARKGLRAYAHFIRRSRGGDDLGNRPVPGPPAEYPRPAEREYWLAQSRRDMGLIVAGHVVKYPYSCYALLRELPDGDLKQRVLAQIYHLTAVS
jgi:hypothetical protein